MFRNLSARLTAVLLALFIAIGVLYIVLTLSTTRIYFQEVNQKLNRILAQHLVAEKVLLKDDRIDETALHDVFHLLMVANPAIEVYLLDRNGRILSFSAPPGKVKLRSVALGPVKRLLAGDASLPVLGDDPRDPAHPKVFSAAPVSLNGRTQGYLYIILGSEAFASEAGMLQGSYILRLGLWAGAGGLLFALFAALLLFNRMTRPLRRLSAAMEGFRQGGFTEPPRFPGNIPRTDDEIGRLAAIFGEMADRIAAQIRDLTDADAHRRELVATIAHDLRTPLTSLRGYLETLQIKEGTLTPAEQNEYLETAMRQAARLAALITDLFALATLDAPGVALRPEPFSLAELLQDIVAKFRLAAEEKRIVLSANTPDGLPNVSADIGLVERLFENLINNSLRSVPHGGAITITAEPAGDRVMIALADTGPGIAPETLQRLFNRKERAVGAAGSGLGLIIVKRILELHGSGIDAASAPSEGTTFRFSLPRSRS